MSTLPAPPRDRHIRRSGDDYATAFLALLPRGQAWPKDYGTTLERATNGLSQYWGTVDGRAGDLLERESDPRYTVELLVDWERAWGLPDPCFQEPLTIGQRHALLLQKMTLLGAQSRAWFINAAAQIGYTITIGEHAPYITGISRCGIVTDTDMANMAIISQPTGLSGTSDSTITLGDPSPVFTTKATYNFSVGQHVHAQAIGGWIEGGIVSYANNDARLSPTATEGVGTYSSWNIGVTGGIDKGTSNSTVTIGDTSPTFSTQAGLLFSVNQLLRAKSSGGWIEGYVVSYGATTDVGGQAVGLLLGLVNPPSASGPSASGQANLTLSLASTSGEGTYSSWEIHPAYISVQNRWQLGPPEIRYYWKIYVANPSLNWFRCTHSECGVDPHLRIGLATDLECLMQRWKPAHTQIVFDYSGLVVGGSMAGTP